MTTTGFGDFSDATPSVIPFSVIEMLNRTALPRHGDRPPGRKLRWEAGDDVKGVPHQAMRAADTQGVREKESRPLIFHALIRAIGGHEFVAVEVAVPGARRGRR